MALTGTTLASALDALALDFNVTSSAGATVGGFCRVDGEFSVVTAIAGNKISVRSRGDNGGVAVAHDLLAPVTFGLATDLGALGQTEIIPVPMGEENLASIGQDTAVIPVPNRNTTYVINKATALATNSTMANPTRAQDGLTVRFLSNTAAAHVVKLVTSDAGITGGNKTTYTFAAFAGAGFTVMAIQGRWLTVATIGVTAS